MSWSVVANGKPAEVAHVVAAEFSTSTCIQPEETVRQAAAVVIAAALNAQDPASNVKVFAQGHQGSAGNDARLNPTGLYNYLKITVEPIHEPVT